MYPDELCAWTPVALSKDVPSAAVMPAWTPSGQVALWRSQSGHLSASDDRCPHRGMRLSHGFVRGEFLSCIYHGWSYTPEGQCKRIPAHPDLTPPNAIKVPVQTVEETGGIIWVISGTADNKPPLFEELAPLRSLTFAADCASIKFAANAPAEKNGPVECKLAGNRAILLLVPQDNGNTLVHILVEEAAKPQTRIAISRAAEQLRRDAEVQNSKDMLK